MQGRVVLIQVLVWIIIIVRQMLHVIRMIMSLVAKMGIVVQNVMILVE